MVSLNSACIGYGQKNLNRVITTIDIHFSRDTKQEKAVSTEDDSPTLHNHSPGEQSSLPSPVGQRDYDIPASSLRQKFTFT